MVVSTLLITHLNDFTNIKFYDPNQKVEMLWHHKKGQQENSEKSEYKVSSHESEQYNYNENNYEESYDPDDVKEGGPVFRSLRRVKTADGVEDDAKRDAKGEVKDDTKGEANVDAAGDAKNDGPCTYECIDWPFSNCKVTASYW